MKTKSLVLIKCVAVLWFAPVYANDTSKMGEPNEVEVSGLIDKAKREGEFSRLTDLTDPRLGFSFTRVKSDGEAKIVEVVFVSCGGDLMIVKEDDIEIETGECPGRVPSTISVSLAAVLNDHMVGNYLLERDGEFRGRFHLKEFYTDASSNEAAQSVIGYKFEALDEDSDLRQEFYINIFQSQIIALDAADNSRLAVLPLTEGAVMNEMPENWRVLSNSDWFPGTATVAQERNLSFEVPVVKSIAGGELQ